MKRQPLRLTVLLDDATRASLDAACVRSGTTASAVVRSLLESFLAAGAQPAPPLSEELALRGEPGTARLTILVEPRIKRSLEVACARIDLTASQVLRRLIRRWLREQRGAA